MSLTAPEPRLNATLAEGRALLAELQAKYPQNGFALFACDIEGGGSPIIPDLKTEKEYDATYVDNSRDLQGEPTDVPFYLYIWNEAKLHYVDVEGVLRWKKSGLPLELGI